MSGQGPRAGSDEVPPIPDLRRRSRRFRFPKAARLSHSADFQRVRNAGRSFHGRFIVLGILNIASDQPMLSPSRVGFITSRRVGPAVVRNRVRRRLREVVRRDRPRLRNGFLLVVVARASAAAADQTALERDWTVLARRAGVFLPPQPEP